MAGATPTLYRFTRWDERIGTLRVAGPLVHAEELNGEDTLEFASPEVPQKGERLVWNDGGTWREHVVVRTEEGTSGLCSVYAESSLCELLDDFVVEQELYNNTARHALLMVLMPTRWGVRHCDDLGRASTLIYHRNALWALRRVAEVWGGEVTAVIGVSGGRVTSRKVRLDARRGSWRGLRFTYGKNMGGCTRTVLEQDVYTALYGFGAGLPYTDSEGNYMPGYRRKLTFGEINGGVDYVEDTDAREVWGRWNEERTEKCHAFGAVTFSDCTSKETLLALTRRALAEAVQPKVCYEVDAAELSEGEAELGDTVAVIDTSRDPEWRLTARIVRRVRTFAGGVRTRVTIGTAQPAAHEQASRTAAAVEALRDDVAGIEGNMSAAATRESVTVAVNGAIANMEDLGDTEF